MHSSQDLAGFGQRDLPGVVKFDPVLFPDKEGAATDAASITAQSWELPEPVGVYTDELMNSMKDFSDTAVIVISRSGGEGADLPRDMSLLIDGTYGDKERADSVVPDAYTYFNGVYTNNGTTPDFEPGESYLELSNPEEEMIDAVCSNFSNVIVVVNANNTMELGWVDEYDSIGAVIWAPGPGATGFSALGEIISGAVNPSGKTVDTFFNFIGTQPSTANPSLLNNVLRGEWGASRDLSRPTMTAPMDT